MTNDGGYSITSSLQLTLTRSQRSSKAMWSGFFAGILAVVAAVVSVVPGWFFNQSGKVSAIRKALQLEVDANWLRLEHLRKAVGPGNPAEGLDGAGDFSALESALKRNHAVISGWQRFVWTNNLVEIVSTLLRDRLDLSGGTAHRRSSCMDACFCIG